jgi:hypothetical protein
VNQRSVFLECFVVEILFVIVIVAVNFLNVSLFAITVDVMDAVKSLIFIVSFALVFTLFFVVAQIDWYVGTSLIIGFVSGERASCDFAVVIC